MEGMLSQEEINALLNGASNEETEPVTKNMPLTSEEVDAIGEISNISMGSAATALSTLVNKKVLITTPHVKYGSWDDMGDDSGKPNVFIQISYKEGLDGSAILVLKEDDVKQITNLMMGGLADGSTVEEGPLSDLHLSAISEAMNQMLGAASTSLSQLVEKKIDINPPLARVVNQGEPLSEMFPEMMEPFVQVSFKMEIDSLVNSEIMQLYSCDFAKEMNEKFNMTKQGKEEVVEPVQEQPAVQPAPAAPVSSNTSTVASYQAPTMEQVNVQPAQFQTFTERMDHMFDSENIDLIMDVPLEVTVELGRTNKSIKEILDFAPGTIIELNKLAGEPIDVLVNGKYVAKGEVVVIEENFGIRVTEIIK